VHPRPGDEVVAEHEIDRDRAEQLGVDLEVGEIHVLDPDPIGETLRGDLLREDFTGSDVERVFFRHLVPQNFDEPAARMSGM
jgi:hypothetical protein